MPQTANSGIVEKVSKYSVNETLDRLTAALRSKGVALFALIDHSGEAEKIGLTMPATKLAIFGSPASGTQIMLAVPPSAIDLPLKILIRQDAQNRVLVSYNSPEYLRQRHGLPAELLQSLAVVETLAAGIAG